MKMYILKTNKSLIRKFFLEDQYNWSWENTTSIIFQKEDGKLIQVFGAKGTYKDLTLGWTEGISDQSGRSLGFFKFVKYSNEIENVSAYYVFK